MGFGGPGGNIPGAIPKLAGLILAAIAGTPLS
jgi:hypothetical protein